MIEFTELKDAAESVRTETTKLYIVYFPYKKFFKVGITPKSLAKRFAGYPEFFEIKTWELPWDKAEEVHRMVVQNFRNFTPADWKFNRPGRNECFRIKDVKTVVEFVEGCIESKPVKFFISLRPEGHLVSSLRIPNGVVKFQRELPLHLATELLSIAKEPTDLMDTVARCIRRIKR